MQICFDDSRLEQTEAGSIIGVVYFELWTAQFPESGWTDFVAVIAGWWMAALQRLMSGPGTSARLYFMDGPMWVVASRKTTGVLLQCTEDRTRELVVHEAVVSIAELEAEITRFARRVVSACARRGIETDDLRTLSAYLAR